MHLHRICQLVMSSIIVMLIIFENNTQSGGKYITKNNFKKQNYLTLWEHGDMVTLRTTQP